MGGAFLDKLVLLTAALLCAGILCACGDGVTDDASSGTITMDSSAVDGGGTTDSKYNSIETDTAMPETNMIPYETDIIPNTNTIDNVTSNDTTNPAMILDDTDIEQFVITPVVASDSPLDLNDYDLIDIFQNKIYANYRAWNALIDGTALVLDFNDEYHDENAATEYYRVRNILNYDTFCELTDAVFTHAFQENTIFFEYIDFICPLFISYNDRLYFNYNTGGCISLIIDFSTAEIINRTNESFNVSVIVRTHDTEERFIYQIANQDGYWVMDNDYWYK